MEKVTTEIVVEYPRRDLRFEWQGGEYVDVSRAGAESPAYDVINVWDHANDTPRIPFTVDALRGCAAEYVAAELSAA